MSEFYKPSEDEIRKKAEVAFSGCVLEEKQSAEMPLYESLQIAFDNMSPQEKQAHINHLLDLSDKYQGPGGP